MKIIDIQKLYPVMGIDGKSTKGLNSKQHIFNLYKYSERTENMAILVNENKLEGPLLWVATWERIGLIPMLNFSITLNNLFLSL